MSMHLYSLPEVYQSSWIEMKPGIAMRYEVDQANESVTLFFGRSSEYVITLDRDNLVHLLDIGAAARTELAGPS